MNWRFLLGVWFVGIPLLVLATAAFLAVVGILGLPLWLLMWWQLS